MKELLDIVYHGLRDDIIVRSVIGLDKDKEVKVYDSIAKTNVIAPFVTISLLPGAQMVHVYGDPSVAHTFSYQISSWGKSRREAVEVADVIDEALNNYADWVTSPYEIRKILLQGLPAIVPDRDTTWMQVQAFYDFFIAR